MAGGEFCPIPSCGNRTQIQLPYHLLQEKHLFPGCIEQEDPESWQHHLERDSGKSRSTANINQGMDLVTNDERRYGEGINEMFSDKIPLLYYPCEVETPIVHEN